MLDILFNRRSQSCKDTHIVYHLKTLKLHIPVILFHSSICAEKHFFPSCWLGEHLWWHLVKHKNKSTQCKFNWLYSQECSQFDVSASAVSSREAVCSQGVSALSFYNIIHIKLGSTAFSVQDNFHMNMSCRYNIPYCTSPLYQLLILLSSLCVLWLMSKRECLGHDCTFCGSTTVPWQPGKSSLIQASAEWRSNRVTGWPSHVE